MSATMARQGGRVQLDHSHLHHALNIIKMAKGGFLCATIEKMKYRSTKHWADVRQAHKSGVEFPRHGNVKAVRDRHPAMLQEKQTDGCYPCENGTAQNPQTC